MKGQSLVTLMFLERVLNNSFSEFDEKCSCCRIKQSPGWEWALRPALMLFMSMLSDNHFLVPSWCDARRENAICMPHSHLAATELIRCALFICLPIHTYVHTHTHTLKCVLASFSGVCVRVCVFLKWTPSRHLKGIYA